MGVSPGWHPDPTRRFEYRYHNGVRWTSDVSARGVRYVDRTAPERPKGATAALVLGIVGIGLSWLPLLFVTAIACGALAVTWAVRGRREVVDEPTRRLLAGALYTGIAAMVLSVVGLWFTVVLARAVDRYQNPEPHARRLIACIEETGGITKATGSLTNESASSASFTIRLRVDGKAVNVETGSLQPGETRQFTIRRQSAAASPECSIVDVDGPLPLGLDIG